MEVPTKFEEIVAEYVAARKLGVYPIKRYAHGTIEIGFPEKGIIYSTDLLTLQDIAAACKCQCYISSSGLHVLRGFSSSWYSGLDVNNKD